MAYMCAWAIQLRLLYVTFVQNIANGVIRRQAGAACRRTNFRPIVRRWTHNTDIQVKHDCGSKVCSYAWAYVWDTTSNADRLLSLVKENNYRIDMILETRAHAYHMTAASYLHKRLSEAQGIDKPLIGIGKRIAKIQKMF